MIIIKDLHLELAAVPLDAVCDAAEVDGPAVYTWADAWDELEAPSSSLLQYASARNARVKLPWIRRKLSLYCASGTRTPRSNNVIWDAASTSVQWIKSICMSNGKQSNIVIDFF
jgi:hypothetical protein